MSYGARRRMVRTEFHEFRGTYETYKAESLTKHLRDLADIIGLAQKVEPVRRLELQEWASATSGKRRGQWVSEFIVEPKP